MKSYRWHLLGLVVGIVILAGCLPSAPPVTNPSPLPATTATPIVPAIKPPTARSPEEVAWNKVVEDAQKEGKVTVYSYSWVGDSGTAVSKAFRNAYGIDLEIITGRGAEFVERLKTEKRMGAMTGDILESVATHLNNAKKSDLLGPSAIDLPVLKEKGAWAVEQLSLDKEGYIVPFMSMVAAPYVNTRMVKSGEEPRKWSDMLQPRWKGQIMLQDPAISVGAYNLLTYVKYGVFTEDFLRQLANQDIRFTTGTQQEAQLLAQGERSLSLFQVDSDTASMINSGAPIRALSMEEGVLVQTMAVARVKDGPHPSATRVFLNWLFSPEGQKVNAQAKGSGSIRNDVSSFSPPAAQVQTKLLVITADMLSEYAQLFQSKYLVKLWNR